VEDRHPPDVCGVGSAVCSGRLDQRPAQV